MDIKMRIDALTEQEAKAALEWCVTKLTINIAVYEESGNGKVIDMDALMESIFDRALNEAQHGHKRTD